MVFQFNDENLNVRIITSIYRVHVKDQFLFLNESGLTQGTEQTNILVYHSKEEARKDLKKLVKIMTKFYEKQHDIDKQPVGFTQLQGYEIEDEQDYLEEDE